MYVLYNMYVLHVFVYMYSRCNIDMIYIHSTNIIDLTKMAYETLWVRIKYFFSEPFGLHLFNKQMKKKRGPRTCWWAKLLLCSFFCFL